MPDDTLKKFIGGMTNDVLEQIAKEVENRLAGSPCGIITFQTDIDKYEIINLKDVLYFFKPKKITEIFMKDGRKIVYPILIGDKKVEIIEHIETRYDNFKTLTNGKLVNIDNIVNYSTYYHRIYFSSDTHIDVTGAAIKYVAKVAKTLGKEMELDGSKGSELKYFRFNEQ